MTKIKLYKTTDCPWCRKVLAYLKQKENVEIEELNCSENEEYKNELLEKTKQLSVPVLDIEGKIVYGFDKRAIDFALK